MKRDKEGRKEAGISLQPQAPGRACCLLPFPGATGLFWVHQALEGPQQGNGKANVFPKCCPQGPEEF